MLFWFLEDVSDEKSLENSEVPHVDKKYSDAADSKEDARLIHKVEDALVVHPEDD